MDISEEEKQQVLRDKLVEMCDERVAEYDWDKAWEDYIEKQ
jgi:hypothetical protein